MMKRTFLSTLLIILVVCCGSAAFAQSYNWTGLYLGAHLSGGNGVAVGNLTHGLAIPTQQDIQGVSGGFQLGYNHQFERVIVGGEISGSLAGSLKGNGNCELRALAPNEVANCETKTNWSAQFLGRLGYAVANGMFLPYIAAGVSVANLDLRLTNSDPQFSQVTTGSGRLAGVVFGGGVFWGVTEWLSFGVEYLRTEYALADLSGRAVCLCSGITQVAFQSSNRSLGTNALRFLVNYKLGN